ncbi:MAG: hypothetical protein ACXWKG_15190, partial [Limisphaerales bacterium]
MHHEQHVTSAARQPIAESPVSFSGVDEVFTPGRLCLVLALMMLCRFPEIILGSHAFFYRDAGVFGYPVAYYIKNAFWHGEMPLWNPYSNCGIPFLAQWNTITLYPGSLIYIAFPLPWSMNAFLFGHLFFAAVGMYKLAHRLFGSRFGATVAGLAFAWNGLSLQCIMWPCNLAALAWIPWVVLLCERAWKNAGREFVWAALAGACQMLTGSPEFILFTWLIVFGWFVASAWQNKRWCWIDTSVMCGCVMLVAVLSAAQLLPTFDLMKHGDRNSSFDTSTWSMPLAGIANFFVPLFRCTPSVSGVWTQDQQQWAASYYVGLGVVLLAAVALIKTRQLKTRLLLVTALVGIVFAMGDAGIVLKFLKSAVPMLGFIRYPIKYIVLTIFALPLLAAAGAAYLQSQLDTRINVKVGFAICIPVIAILFAVLLVSDKYRSTVCFNAALRLVALLVAIGLLTLASKSLNRRTKIASLFGVLLVFGIDICFHVPSQNPTVITAAYERRLPQMKTLPKLGESQAMISLPVQVIMENSAHPDPLNMYMGQRLELFGNCNLLDCGGTNAVDYTCIPKVNGFYSLHLREQTAVTKLLYSRTSPRALVEFLGVSQVTSEQHLFAWDTVEDSMPFATVGQQPVFADETTTLELLRNFKPRETVFLPAELKNLPAVRDESARVIKQKVGTHEQRYEVEASRNTMFVVAQTYDH